MAEMILPGTFIEVRPEGLIVPGRVSVGNLGVVGTASKGEVLEPTILSSYTEALEKFGEYDPWIDGESNELTLNRALEQAYRHGATTVIAVRVESSAAQAAAASQSLDLDGGGGMTLNAATPGTWGNELEVNVAAAEEDAFVENESVDLAVVPPTLSQAGNVIQSARNRIRFQPAGGGEQILQIVYGLPPGGLVAGQVSIDLSNGELQFGQPPAAGDQVYASYAVAQSAAVKVTLRYQNVEEVFTVVSGDDLANDLEDSSLATVSGVGPFPAIPLELPPGTFVRFVGGSDGAAASPADYDAGLRELLQENAHIIVAAGQVAAGNNPEGNPASFGDELDAHLQTASSDEIKRDRIGVIGSGAGATLNDLFGHTLSSDRVIFVAPGIRATDAPTGIEVDLTGAYAAAAVAGLISSFSAHISPTNKTLRVGGLETNFTRGQLKQLVLSRLLVVEERQGFRIVKGITTSTNTAFHQITTRRIVDFAKFGVRSAANPYIGLLNNERVRAAMQATINSFLQEMVDDEMLISYELAVTATRAEEIKGIARVTIVLRPTFSIDFIKVTMFLE